MKHLKLGCDPEIFLADASGALRSAIGLIGGTKHDPRPLPIGEGFCVQEDNVAIEFNIPPAESKEAWLHDLKKIKAFLALEVQKQGLYFNAQSAASFPSTELQHPMAFEFGCEPDFNSWRKGRVNRKPQAEDRNLRSAGGHVHVGYEFASKEDVVSFMQYMDLFLGVPSVLMDEGEMRKQLYGKAGAFRYKPYGGEYRVLSNFWIFDDKYINWVWDATQQAMVAWQNKTVDVNLHARSIIETINNNNKADAQQLINQFSLQVV